jgi:hypothetical protein
MRFFTPDFFDEAPYSGPLISLLALFNFILSRKFARIFATQGVLLYMFKQKVSFTFSSKTFVRNVCVLFAFFIGEPLRFPLRFCSAKCPPLGTGFEPVTNVSFLRQDGELTTKPRHTPYCVNTSRLIFLPHGRWCRQSASVFTVNHRCRCMK